ncbi:MAG: ABC transporter ATP-binding protein [Firmicutes bacterium]|nr:ABC transporter ATP-binding protein [Bacillota bacterium]
MQTDTVLRAKGLTKVFKRRRAVDGLDLEVSRGEVFGFLGPNGAGKTTTIRMLLGLIRPSSGAAELLGHNVATHHKEALQKVGAVVETPCFYKHLSGRENLEIFARLSGGAGHQRIEEVLELVGLGGRAGDKVRTYSHGMRQRLGIAQALLPAPELVILDEPTDGLDPRGMKEIRDLVARLARTEEITIFLSSHLLHEVEQLCDRVAIVDHGKTVAAGKVEELLKQSPNVVRLRLEPQGDAGKFLRKIPGVAAVEEDGKFLRLRLAGAEVPGLVAECVTGGFSVFEVGPERDTLEEYFLDITGGGKGA